MPSEDSHYNWPSFRGAGHHHPLFVADPDEDNFYWNIPRARRSLLLDLLRRSRVDAMFAGHLHRNTFAEYDGLQMVNSGPVGYPLGDNPPGTGSSR